MSTPVKIYWLASYPKSGNTWMRALLTNYLGEGEGPADINDLRGGPIASARLWFDEWVGLEASALPSTIVERLRPEVYRRWAAATPGPAHFKVHDTWRRTDLGEPLFPVEITAGVVYIVRNPVDLVASCANHWAIGLEEAAAQLCGRESSADAREARLGEQLPQALGGWSSHVTSWLDESGLDVLLVRYEDLHEDAVREFDRVVRFCGLDEDPDRIRQAVQHSSFAELRRQEESGRFSERPVHAAQPFFRRGEVGAGRQEVPAAIADAVTAANADVMRRLGYLDHGLAADGEPDDARDRRPEARG